MTIDNYESLKTDIELIKKDIHQFGILIGKFDAAIDKMGEVANNFNKIVAVHENKLHHHHTLISELDTRRKEGEDRMMTFFERMASLKEEMKVDRANEIEKLGKTIVESIKEIEVKITDVKKDLEKVEARLSIVEKWKWGIVGASALMALIFQKIDILSLIP